MRKKLGKTPLLRQHPPQSRILRAAPAKNDLQFLALCPVQFGQNEAFVRFSDARSGECSRGGDDILRTQLRSPSRGQNPLHERLAKFFTARRSGRSLFEKWMSHHFG